MQIICIPGNDFSMVTALGIGEITVQGHKHLTCFHFTLHTNCFANTQMEVPIEPDAVFLG